MRKSGKRGMGVVSGTSIAHVVSRILADGDPTGDYRRAIASFPYPEIGRRVIKRYFNENGRGDAPYPRLPMFSRIPNRELEEITVVASYCEVWLAKEGHNDLVGINLLEKVQPPIPPSLFGAMLAGVDAVLIGAGIPLQIADVLAAFTEWKTATYRLSVTHATQTHEISFDPISFIGTGEQTVTLLKPLFYPIVSLPELGNILKKRTKGRIDGLILECATDINGKILSRAGGHNAPPRRGVERNANGEPIYDANDLPKMDAVRRLGLPFWLAGAWPLQKALAEGAAGIQAGTIFALCEESGYPISVKKEIWEREFRKELIVHTSAYSSSGYPFKVAVLPGTLAEEAPYKERKRICDLGYLREGYEEKDGTIGFRCSAEPVRKYVKKGGAEEDTKNIRCLCNALMTDVGLGGENEKYGLFTVGDDLRFVTTPTYSWDAKKAVRFLLTE
jgi:NAD(P)H-dependent flavin oxidoreductase YrpB (nitropropane dioxygenase family)